jgi:hypothetical protein
VLLSRTQAVLLSTATYVTDVTNEESFVTSSRKTYLSNVREKPTDSSKKGTRTA